MSTQYLYHYTNANSLFNIINNSYLRATNAWHLADGSECRHAIDTLRKIAPNLSSNHLWNSLVDVLLSIPRYVVCFSEVRNDPDQWKNYGSDGAGACIVIDSKKAAYIDMTVGWDRFKCQYDQVEQRNQLLELASDLSNGDSLAFQTRMNEFWKCNICFKRKEFFQENEVRYVLTTPPPLKGNKQTIFEPEAMQLLHQNSISSYSHPSAFFDELCRPYEPFCIKGAISKIIFGPRFKSTLKYWEYLNNNYSIIQL